MKRYLGFIAFFAFIAVSACASFYGPPASREFLKYCPETGKYCSYDDECSKYVDRPCKPGLGPWGTGSSKDSGTD